VESWINTSYVYTADGRIVTIGNGATNPWALSVNATVPSYYAIMTSSTVNHATARTNSLVNNGTWHYIVGIRNPESIYMNGILQSSTLSDSWSFEVNTKIGSRGTSQYFYGAIDEIRISNINRSAAWISTSYNNMYSSFSFMTFSNEETLVDQESDSEGINYGILYPGDLMANLSEIIYVIITGNTNIDALISGTDMCTDYPDCAANTIPITQQHYATSNLNYASTSDGVYIADVVGQLLELTTNRPDTHPANQFQDIYWGISVPSSQEMGIYNGRNSFIATTSQ
jgi:hypothetical protein